MNFIEFFIRRPVFATAMALLLVLIGAISFSKLVVRQFPRIDSNVISITASYPGANAALMESFVTTPIENALTGISDLDYMTSSSSNGQSQVTLNLDLNSDINRAMIDVQSKISQVLRRLPNGVQDPTITEVNSDSFPSLIVLFSSPNLRTEQISDYIKRSILPVLSNVNGVAQVEIFGNRTYAMRVWLDTNKMRALNVTATDVQNALTDQNVQSTAGQINRQEQVVTIDAQTELHSAAQFSNLVIRRDGNKIIRLKDIGRVELGALNYRSAVYADGKLGVGIGISYKSDANPLAAAKAVRKTLATIQLPSNIRADIVRDSSIYIEKSIEEVAITFFVAVLLVVLVIFAFLGSIRLITVPLITIPLSIIGTFIIMFALNYTINTLTLLAFVLAIGMVVDDAIVVMENIHRHLLMGKSAKQAAIDGAKQIVFAVIGMTITLMAVYAPIGFTSGLTGALFREFAFTLAGSVLLSGVIALTICPVLCGRMLAHHDDKKGLSAFIERIMERMTAGYGHVLSKVLSRKILIPSMMGLILLCGIMFLFPLLLTSSIAPTEDQGVILAVAEGPTSASINYTNKYSQQMGKILESVPEKENTILIDGRGGAENSAFGVLTLKDWSQRKRSATQIISAIDPGIQKIPGFRTFLVEPGSLPGSSFYGFNFVITTNGSYQELNNVADKIVQEAEKNPNIFAVRTDLNFDKPELVVEINRNKAGYLGVSMTDIQNALSVAFGEPEVNEFSLDGYAYYIIPQLQQSQYNSSNILNQINVRAADDSLIPLSTLITMKNSVTSNSFNHFQGQRSVTFNAFASPLFSTQQTIKLFEGLAKKYMQPGMSYDFAGDTREFIKTKTSMLVIFIAALLIIYLVLAAQFESFRDPFVILVTVPLAITGALGGLFFSGSSLNIYTEIGLVTLIGLISKHGILMVEFAKQCRWYDGMSPAEAIHHAACVRLKPVLMTTAAMVLGAVPLIIAHGAGAAARRELGWAIGSGMVFGTLFTLFILPTMYLVLPGLNNKNPKDKSSKSQVTS
ncbi:MAG: efflux RND transporter permease subunit [Pseudomonadota bacterium]